MVLWRAEGESDRRPSPWPSPSKGEGERLLLFAPELGQLDQHLDRAFHLFEAGELQRRVEIVHADRQVRRRQSLFAELRAIRPAADRLKLRLQADIANGLL